MRSNLAPWLAVLTLTAAGAAAAAGYGLTAPKRYRATAQVLVAPVSTSDPTFAGIGVLRDTGGKRTAAASVAALIRTPQIADAAAAQLGSKRSRQSLLDALHVHVVDSSDVVAVTAEDTSADGAAQLANTFANVLIAQRSATFQSELAAAIRRDRQLVASANDPAGEISQRLATLLALQGRPDPTIRVAAQAVAPPSASWPNVPLLIGIGAGIGAIAGVLVAFVALGMRRASGRPAGTQGPRFTDGELEELGDRLEARLVRRESALAARERDLKAKLDELRAAQETTVAAAQDKELLARRERQLAERIAAATKREAELARRAAEVALRERDAAAEQEQAAAAAAAATEEAKAAEAAEAAIPPVPPPAQNGLHGSYNLVTLERLVDERGGAFPERLEEWSSYLYFLREYASADGAVPASFDGLIHDTFEELLA
jgi:capsular polysaccharide biosynthesis protein